LDRKRSKVPHGECADASFDERIVARLRFADACGDVDTDSTAVGGISSNEDVECFSLGISRELEARVWAESIAEVWETRRGKGARVEFKNSLSFKDARWTFHGIV
jgi:hypothetical protein